MRRPIEVDITALGGAEAVSSGIVLTIEEFSARVRQVIGLKLDGQVSNMAPILSALIDDSIRTAVENVIAGATRNFKSEAEVTALVEETVAKVAKSVRKQMNVFVDIALTGYETADAINDPSDTRYVKVSNGALIKLAIRAHHIGDFELEIKLREVMRRRKYPVIKERVLNLYHLQDTYHTLGNREQCIAINKELIAYIRELSGTDIDEATLKLGDSLEFIECRAHDILFNLRSDIGEDCQDEAISYYDSISKKSRKFEVLGIALRRLRAIFDDRGDFTKALHYALRLSKTQHEADNPDEVRRIERHVDKYLRNLGINLTNLGRDPWSDLAKLSPLDATSLNTLAERARGGSRFTTEVALLEVLLTKELTAAERICTFQDLDTSYEVTSNAQKKLELSDRYLAFLDGITADALEPGQNLQSLKFGARDMRYKTQLKFKDKLDEAAKFDPDEMRIFYEDHLVSDDADLEDRITCFAALGNIYEAASDYARAWDCAIQILDLKPPYIARVGANEAESRNGDRLGNDQRLAARGSVVKAIRERKESAMREQMEAARIAQEAEAREAKERSKRELVAFLQALRGEAPKWRKAGIFKDMHLIPDDKKAQVLIRFDELVAAINDSKITKLTQFVRQNLNAIQPFVRPGTLGEAIDKLQKII